MIRDFIVKLLANYSFILLTAMAVIFLSHLAIPAFDMTDHFLLASSLLLELFVTLLINRLSVFGIHQLNIKTPLIEHMLAYIIVLAQVYFLGWIWNWRSAWQGSSLAWDMFIFFIVVSVVFLFIYLFDLVRINKDITFINKQIKCRRKIKEKDNNDGA